MCDNGATPVIDRCTFTGNESGAVYCLQSSPVISNCLIVGNDSSTDGAGIYLQDSTASIGKCTFLDNTATNHGAGIYLEYSDASICNCLFVDNAAANCGGGVFVENGAASIGNCTFVGNAAAAYGGGISCFRGSATVVNSVLRNNSPEEIFGNATVTYSNIKGGYSGEGNINANPLFVDPDDYDFHIGPGSPCIDAGDSTAVPDDVTTDLDGNPRFKDDPDTPDTGIGYPCVDMGPYELQANAPPTIGSLSADPNPVWEGETLTLAANDVQDPDGYVDLVEFYCDGNMDCQVDGSDLLLATDANGNDGWEVEIPTEDLPSGTIQLMARACDDYTEWSAEVCSIIEVISCSLEARQVRKLAADDAEPGDNFGRAVSVGGNFIVVSAPYDDDAGSDSGSAYVLDANTGQQIHELTADDAAEDDNFGYSVSVSGNTIVVGAHRDDDAGSSSGSAYVFDATTGQQTHKLTADDGDAGDSFGYSVSVSGNTIVVGAYGDDDAGSKSGSAYVFDAGTGQQLHKLTADDAAADDYFARSVSISGEIIVVGAYLDDDAGSDSGSAYVFDAGTGQQLHKLTADDAAEGDRFGRSVAIDGETIVVGAHYDDHAGGDSGSVYVFDATTGEQIHKLTADDAAGGDYFGISVSISDDTIVVGAYGDDDAGSESGAAYIFDVIGGGQLDKLTAADAAADDWFGRSVSVSGNTIVAGAYGDDNIGEDSGSAYLFTAPPDCNNNGVADDCDIHFGASEDANDNGIPDECEDECPEDVNSDQIVDIDDLFAVLAAWGTCDECPEDINEDGVVDIDDLFAVLAAWGPCP